MQALTEFAAAKINLALHVCGRRADGYHELDSAVAFADVGDELSFTPSSETQLSVSGPFAAAVPVTAENLVLRAFAALDAVVALQPVHMHLAKNLPVASGIGGGSADAAAALRGLMRMNAVKLDPETLQRLALSLGADVPVCLHGEACRMQGVGEKLSALATLPAPALVLANPLQACGTADVFRTMGLKPGDRGGSGLDVSAPQSWRNDMGAAAQQVLPVIADVLRALETLPGVGSVRMSGSGATCFGLFPSFDAAQRAAALLQSQRPDWWVAAARLS